jgi:hypothetical protein
VELQVTVQVALAENSTAAQYPDARWHQPEAARDGHRPARNR